MDHSSENIFQKRSLGFQKKSSKGDFDFETMTDVQLFIAIHNCKRESEYQTVNNSIPNDSIKLSYITCL